MQNITSCAKCAIRDLLCKFSTVGLGTLERTFFCVSSCVSRKSGDRYPYTVKFTPHAPRIERVRALYLSKCPHTCAVKAFAVGVVLVDLARVGGGERSATTGAYLFYFWSPLSCKSSSLNFSRAVSISQFSPSAFRMCSHGSGLSQSLPSNRHLLQNTRYRCPWLFVHNMLWRAPSVFHAFSAWALCLRSRHDLHQLRSEKGRACLPCPPG